MDRGATAGWPRLLATWVYGRQASSLDPISCLCVIQSSSLALRLIFAVNTSVWNSIAGWPRLLCNLGLQEAINNTWTQPTDGSSFTSANRHHNAKKTRLNARQASDRPRLQSNRGHPAKTLTKIVRRLRCFAGMQGGVDLANQDEEDVRRKMYRDR